MLILVMVLNSTVGHGLGVTPNMIIIKQRGSAEDWAVYHQRNGAGNFNL